VESEVILTEALKMVTIICPQASKIDLHFDILSAAGLSSLFSINKERKASEIVPFCLRRGFSQATNLFKGFSGPVYG